MVTSRGAGEVDAFFAAAPDKLRRILRGAGRAGANVIADEAGLRVTSDLVRSKIVVRTRARDDRIFAYVTVADGFAKSVGIWLEFGTREHVISVDVRRAGRTPEGINSEAKKRSLKIGDVFAGEAVIHPGAKAYPWLRVSLDTTEDEALAAAKSYVAARISRAGLRPTDDGDDA